MRLAAPASIVVPDTEAPAFDPEVTERSMNNKFARATAADAAAGLDRPLQTILVVLDPVQRRDAALRRGIELARLSGAVLHLCLFDHDPMIQLYGEDLEQSVRRAAIAHFIEMRLHSLAVDAAELASRGLSVECEVVWAPAPHQAIIAKASEIGADLVIKNIDEVQPRRFFLRPLDWKLLRLLPADLMLLRGDAAALPRRIAAAVDTGDDARHPEALNQRVLRHSLRLARYVEAELHLVHVAPYIAAGEMVDRRLQARYRQQIDRDITAFRQFAEAEDVPRDRCHVLSGEAAPGLSRFAERIEADLLAIGSVYRSAWDRFMLGTTAEQLLTETSRDVLMIKDPGFATALQQHADLQAWRQALVRSRG